NSGGSYGFESFVYNGKLYKKTLDIRDKIHDSIIKEIGGKDRGKKKMNLHMTREVNASSCLTENLFIDRGKKKMNLHMTREVNASSCLTENLFIDSKEDSKKLKDDKFIDKIAKGHAVGLAEAFNLDGGSSKPSE